MIEPGTVIDGYRVLRTVGSGGMGTVYAADDPRLPRLDALKVLGAELSADADFRARFQREADIAAALDHPNIVSIYDRGETADGHLWIAMQLVDGIDAEHALNDGAMTAHRAVRIVSDVAEALDYAHERGVVHRDIKPANFLIAAPGQPDERTLLGDFGIARALDDAAITATATVMATADFAPPESATGAELTASSDLYSLGASLFRLLTGASPYQEVEGTAAQLLAHVRRPPPQVSARAPWLGDAFDTVIATAMAKDPAGRYGSGHDFAQAAAAALRQARRQAGHTGPQDTIATSRSAAWAPSPEPSAPDGAGSPPASSQSIHGRSRRRRTALFAVAATVVAVAAAAAGVLATRSDPDSGPGPPTGAAAPAPPSATAAAHVAEADLPALLLDPAIVNGIIGAPLTAEKPGAGLDPTEFASVQIECASVMLPILKATYSDSGYVATYTQGFAADPNGNSAFESVVAFPSTEMAETFVERRSQIWQPCGGTEFTLRAMGGLPERTYQFDAPQNTGGVLSAVATRVGKPIACQHALASRQNVVIDVFACVSPAVTDQGVEIARQIADKIH
jgi:serine/threonine protein kinase